MVIQSLPDQTAKCCPQEFLALLRETSKKKNHVIEVVPAQLSPMLRENRVNSPARRLLAARHRPAVVTPAPMV